jgi:hypothetical protein
MILRPSQILIKANADQKQFLTLSDGSYLHIVPNRGMYYENGRETNPVIAEVVQAAPNVPLSKGDIVVLHHNLIIDPVYQVGEFSVIPYDRWTMARIVNGVLIAQPENIICERIKEREKEGNWYKPVQNNRGDMVRVIETGQVIGIRKWADYEVIYNWNGVEHRCIVIWKTDVVCEVEEAV